MQPALYFEAAPEPAPVMPLPIMQMALFRRLMAHAGQEVDLARMCTDRGYAFERLALAHASDIPRLRQAALDLFATYDRNTGFQTHH